MADVTRAQIILEEDDRLGITGAIGADCRFRQESYTVLPQLPRVIWFQGR